MKARDRYLTGILLILIGIMIGIILTVYQKGPWVNDLAKVEIKEIKRSSEPFFSDEELGKIDGRFLFKNIAKEVTPTVVYIETVVPLDGKEYSEEEKTDTFWDRLLPRRARTVGSGVIITVDGYILTNNHVINDAINNTIRVVLNDKRAFRARVVGSDPTTDLAVIKIDARNLPTVIIGNSDNVDVGEWVLAIGNPFRLRSTVTAGIVSALSRDVQIIDDLRRVESFIQTDAAINRGNSGGALVNTSAELVGINTAIASQNGTHQGYGFAIPSNLALKVARDIMEYGEVRRAVLGVKVGAVNFERAMELGMDNVRGVEILGIDAGSAADRFDLNVNDIVLSVNGEEVNEINQLQEKIAVLRPGEIVKLSIFRNGDQFERNVKLGRMEAITEDFLYNPLQIAPEEEQTRNRTDNVEYENYSLGFKITAYSNPQNSGRYDFIITEIRKNTEAHESGLNKGDIIEKVNGKKVEDLQSLKDLIERSLDINGIVGLQVKSEDGSLMYHELKK